ncbi:Glutathione S-transferase, omega [hydrothermal vent metagenome]|uniref:Glutathione S-transferase, omega n=1 Tax=hydrothermal vent metagenome TaxID=652676 RepID=A0A3B1DCF4_9ZZZZ
MDFVDEQNDAGEFVRQEDVFRSWVTCDGSSAYPAEPNRYHLYVSLACPWAHRTVIVRKLKKLESVIGMTVLDPIRDERGWAFREGEGCTEDPINQFTYLSEAYISSEPGFRGRVTVPVLWDKKTARILNNSEDDITRMFNSAFNALTQSTLDIYPEALRFEMDPLIQVVYEKINNGVYKAGFSTTQVVYEKEVTLLFETLDQLENRLSKQRYLLGSQLCEVDLRLFPTLIRFDLVYHGHFKCNLRRILDYPNLYNYMKDIYQQAHIAETVNFDHIKRHYYVTHTEINPTQIVPLGPVLDLNTPHGREKLT